MDVPRKISAPAGYYDESDDDDYDYDDEPPKFQPEPTIRLMSPPETLTTKDITEEERRRFMRETNVSLSEENTNNTSNLNDSVIKSSGDPVGIARQVRHLHNRVKLLEEELQTLGNRQIFMMGLATLFAVTGCIKILHK